MKTNKIFQAGVNFMSNETMKQAVRGSSDKDDYPVIEVQKTTGEWVDTYTIGVDEKKIFMKIDWEEL